MDIIVTGRHIHIADDFREQVEQRFDALDRKERFIRAEVQLTLNENSRQPDEAARVEITLIGPGPVVRAEAAADEKTVAFEHAFDRLQSRLRKAADRRRSQRAMRGATRPRPFSTEDHLPIDPTAPQSVATPAPSAEKEDEPAPATAPTKTMAGLEIQGDGPLVVREKHFTSVPLTLAQALDEMELVGHDFFLYVDAATGQPSVVYRRKAYDYGVIHLSVVDDAAETTGDYRQAAETAV
ncbi:MAG: ribosome-associated translation inhibitor RaiA [Propionibacteriaceae bacterium]|jgi:ribosomal subunit interface protein|nr:ribosome-associated translation inhibitor RaiA [Propionibacteriaceae bacterium]